MTDPQHELVLGGAKSGKSRLAEQRAAAWMAEDRGRTATLVATALAADDEMAERIARHRADRAARVSALHTVEAPHALGLALRQQAHTQRLLVVDCLTLWLTQCLLPPAGTPAPRPWQQERDELLAAIQDSVSPIVLVSNEISLGVTPMSREARAFIDTLGLLHQAVAERCTRVTLMVAGCELRVKEKR